MTQLFEPNVSTHKNSPPIDQTRYNRLLRRIRAFDRRVRLHEALYYLPVALVVGAVIGVAAGIASRVSPVLTTQQALIVTGAATGIAVLFEVSFIYIRRRSPLQCARHADRYLGLKERVATAVQMRGVVLSPLAVAQLDDTIAALDNLPKRIRLPYRMLRPPLFITLGLVAVVGLLAVAPNDVAEAARRDQAAKAAMKQEALNLQRTIQAIDPQAAKDDPELARLKAELEKLQQKLEQGDMSVQQAQAQIEATKEQLRQASDPNYMARKAAMNQLAQDFRQNDSTRKAGDALSAEDYTKAADELRKAAQDPQKLAQNPQQLQQLQQALQRDQSIMSQADPQLGDAMKQAAQSLQDASLKQDPKAAADALNNLANQVQQAGQKQDTRKQVEQSLSQLQQSQQKIGDAGKPSQQTTGQKDSTPQFAKDDKTGNQNQNNGQTNDNPQNLSDPNQSQQNNQSGQQQLGDPQQQDGDQRGGDQPRNGTGSKQGTKTEQNQGEAGGKGDSAQQSSGQQGQEGKGDKVGTGGNKPGDAHIDTIAQDPTKRQTGKGEQQNIQGRQGNTGTQQTQDTSAGSANGQSNIPYSQVLDDYSNQASDALARNDVPPTMRDLVKDYFDSLRSDKK